MPRKVPPNCAMPGQAEVEEAGYIKGRWCRGGGSVRGLGSTATLTGSQHGRRGGGKLHLSFFKHNFMENSLYIVCSLNTES